MEGYSSKSGKKLMMICMGNNYTNPMVVYREYIQNACDALYDAVRKDIVKESSDKFISVGIDEANREVRIIDRGTGVRKEDIGPILVNIGSSFKDGIDDIGTYGIGRLVGANWCDKITFETSYKGESEKSILTFDSLKARQLCNSKECTMSLDEINDAVTSCVYHPEDPNLHYMRVTLHNANNELLDIDNVREYLSEVVPVGYEFEFEDTILSPAFETYPEFKDLLSKERVCIIDVNTDYQILKSYSPQIEFTGNDKRNLTRLSFFKIEDDDYGLLAWGWYSLCERPDQMNEVKFRHIRLRKHNMVVGDVDYLNNCFKGTASPNYFVGELFVVHPNITPTGSRDGLNDSTEKSLLFLHLKDKFKQLYDEYNKLSKLGSQALKPLCTALVDEQKLKVKLKDADEDDAQEIKTKLKEARKNISDAKDELKAKMDDISKYANMSILAEDIVTYWEKDMRKKVSEVNAKSKPGHKIDGVSLKKIVEEAQKEQNKGKEKENNPSSETPSSASNNATTTTKENSEPKETDRYKVLGKDGWKLMKLVYSVLDSNKNIDPKSLGKIKKALEKKILR
ncbi:ATP-binding protein [Parabacteroides distasonis]|nr:ATP-binding protein [Parabacteroides distasonis]